MEELLQGKVDIWIDEYHAQRLLEVYHYEWNET